MNKIYKIFAVLIPLTGLMLLSSCVKDKFDAPDPVTPAVDFTANTTIAELYQYFADSIPLGFGIINDDIIIKGTVVANDESGNIYKTIYIEDADRGLQIAIDQTDMYTKYRLGQVLYIKCQGLYLGAYGGVLQLGYYYDDKIGRIPSVLVDDHIFADGLPGNVPEPILISIPAFSDSRFSMLVRIDSLYFDLPEIGQPMSSPDATTNHILKDMDGNFFYLRTSNYATFAGQLVPSGLGSVVGILSYYDPDWQFYIRNMNDLIGFGGHTPVLASENFATAGSLGTFTAYSVTGDQDWYQSSYDIYTFAKMSGYDNGYYANEDWLISPSMNFDYYTEETLNFFTMMNYGTAGDGSLKVMYSTDYTSGDPNAATWTDITSLCALSAGAWAYSTSGDVDVSMISGSNVHIAFKYFCTTSDVSTWEVGGISITGTPNN